MGPSSVKDRKHAPCRKPDRWKETCPWARESKMMLQNVGSRDFSFFPCWLGQLDADLAEDHPCQSTQVRASESQGVWATVIVIILELPWCLSGKDSGCNTEDLGSTPGLGRSPGGGRGYPLQYSRLGNPTDRGVAGYSPWDPKKSDTPEHAQQQQEVGGLGAAEWAFSHAFSKWLDPAFLK